MVYWWSWKQLGIGTTNDDGVLPNALSEENPTGNSHDVRFRPLPHDILRALTDGNNDFESIRVGNVGFPGRTRQVAIMQLRGIVAETKRIVAVPCSACRYGFAAP